MQFNYRQKASRTKGRSTKGVPRTAVRASDLRHPPPAAPPLRRRRTVATRVGDVTLAVLQLSIDIDIFLNEPSSSFKNVNMRVTQ